MRTNPSGRRRAVAAVLSVLLAWPGSLPAEEQESVPARGGPLGVPLPLFPAGNWWNLDVSSAPVAPSSDAIIAFIGATDAMHPDFGGENPDVADGIYGIPYIVVEGDQPKRAVVFDYQDESDGVDHANGETSFPFYPIPDEAISQPHWIEGGQSGDDPTATGDRHMLIVDKTNNHLYELYAMRWTGSRWEGGSGAFFDMNVNGRRPEGWTSADAAGLAMLPGLVRYDEVYEQDEPIRHAFRMTVHGVRNYVWPASHRADTSANTNAPPLGARLRLKASKDISGHPPALQRIFQAMKTYGLIVADTGSDMYVQGTHDPRWDNGILNPAFRSLKASDFEVIQLGWNPAGLSVSDSSANEGEAATFTVTRAGSTAGTASATWSTEEGTAIQGSDFVAASGTVSFAAGEASRTVTVATLEDAVDEPSETFHVILSSPVGVTISDDRGVGTLVDDDAPPPAPTPVSISIGNASATESGVSPVFLDFPVTLTPAPTQQVTVSWSTIPGTATTADFTTVTGATLTFLPGETAKTARVSVTPDVADEALEKMTVKLSSPTGGGSLYRVTGTGTITDDDPPPTVSVSDATVTELQTATYAIFTVTLSATSHKTVKVKYQTTKNGTARPGVDFKAIAATGMGFLPGQTSKTFRVKILVDSRDEPDETFQVKLSSPTAATLGDRYGIGTIIDND